MKKCLIRYSFALSLALLVGCASSPSKEQEDERSFSVIKNSIPQAVVYLKNDQKSEAKEAIDFLNSCLKKSRKTQLPIVAKTPREGNVIVFDVKQDLNLLTEDQFEITFPNKKTLKITCSQTSARWAVNFLLKEYGGFDWLFPGEAGIVYPDAKDFIIPATTIKKTASYKINRSFNLPSSDCQWMKAMNGKKSLNLNHEMFKHIFPYKIQKRPFPEYVKPTIKGKKFPPQEIQAYWQPCMTNPRCLEEGVKNILTYLKKNPDTRSISLGVNDNGGFCECKNCLAMCSGKKNLINRLDKSNLYYSWLNKIASKVCEKYPNLVIGCLAYREVMTPPNFKLHKNIVPLLTIDVSAWSFPDTRENRKELIDAWSEKAEHLGVWNYGWGLQSYGLPRISFKAYDSFYKYLHQHKGAASFDEAYISYFEGPKRYLYYNLLWNVNLNLDKTLNAWYSKCVGPEAGKYLKEYFDFWETYLCSPRLKKTCWYEKRKATYIVGDDSYVSVMTESEMKYCRELMEKVVTLADTPRRKVRAQKMMDSFEYYEGCYYGTLANVVPSSKVLRSADQAVALIEQIPKAVGYIRKKDAIYRKTVTAPPFTSIWQYQSPHASSMKRLKLPTDFSSILSSIPLIAPFVGTPKVTNVLAKVTQDQKLPEEVLALLDFMKNLQNPNKNKNLLPSPSFEKDFSYQTTMKKQYRVDSYKRTAANPHTGDYSLEITPGKGWKTLTPELKVKPNTPYILTGWIYVPKGRVEGKVRILIDSMKDGKMISNHPEPLKQLTNGEWNFFTLFRKTTNDADSVRIYFVFNGFEQGEKVYLDDLQFVELNNS